MDAKELRVGNIVWDEYSGEMIVHSIDGDSKNVTLSNLKFEGIGIRGLYDVSKLRPVPLTQARIELLGFKYTKNTNGGFERWEIKSQKGKRIKLIDKKLSWDFGEYSDHILYVHQLQNLYFALTGEDLTIIEQTLTVKG